MKKKTPKNKKAPKEDTNIELVAESSFSGITNTAVEESDDENCESFQDLVVEVKKKKKSGGFQSMGFSHPVLKGVLRKGYKVPTPIQRKAIPVIMEGRDVVGMARTGSGKTAAFVLPMLEKLRKQEGKIGIKGLVLSPTRELALQTYTFTKELGKYTNLKFAVILGGDNMDNQFATMHDNPDIVIATPGRLLHVLVEMEAKLSSVEYVVFDEADRLFEMGFQEQLNEIIHRLPSHRQTLLFSATLPQLLVDFAKAGLHDPELIRLDLELKLSENLRTVFLGCKAEDKIAILVYLLKSVINSDELTVVFTATRHHVEYLKDILAKAAIECSYVYSALDHEARQMNVTKFRSKRVKIMIVTDVAARGIDIPLLDNVINFNFPAKPKLFVHRVGRAARAGRCGTAYSLVAFDEAPFLYDLHLFLDRPLSLAKNTTGDGVYGFVPQHIIDEENDAINQWIDNDSELTGMQKVCNNAYKQYSKTRQSPSSEAVRKMKEFTPLVVGFHPLFKSKDNKKEKNESERNCLLDCLKNYRPNSTIFEINTVKNNKCFDVMKTKRQIHDKVVQRRKEAEIKKKSAKEGAELDFKDNNVYLRYQSDSKETEKGLELEKNKNVFDDAVFDIMGDDSELVRKQKNSMKWDRKKKKFVRENDAEPKKKKIKTESGTWISASYKTDLYKKWKEKSKQREDDSENDVEEDESIKERNRALNNRKRMKGSGKPARKELKSKEEILKKRILEEKKQKFQKWRKNENAKRGGKSGDKSGVRRGGRNGAVKRQSNVGRKRN